MEIRRLTPEDDRSAFRSGNIELDRFFQRFAGQNQFRHYIGTTHVTVEANRILGFVTVAVAELEISGLPQHRRKGLPAYPIPCLRIARLAVAAEAQGKGVGAILLRHVLSLAKGLVEDLGCAGVLVDAKAEAIAFYEKYGFGPLVAVAGALSDRPRSTPMFLPTAVIPS